MSTAAILRRVLAALMLVALAAPACVARGRSAGNGELRVTAVSGEATARFPAAEGFVVLKKDDRVPVGSELRTLKDASVRLQGNGDRAIELGPESQATLVGAAQVTLETGRLLAEPGESQRLRIDSRGVTAGVTGGLARVERILGALRVGVYRGSARVEFSGRSIDVPAYRQVVIAGGVPLDREALPLELSQADRWDRRALGDVLDFDRELGQFGRGFDQQFAGRATVPEFYSSFVTVQSIAFVGRAIPTFVASDVLVGLVYGTLLSAKTGDPAAVPRMFAEALAARDQGATWGLIAKEHGLDLPILLRAVLDAIRKGTTPPAAQTPGGSVQGRPSPTPQPTSSPKPKPTMSPTPGPTPSPTPTTCSVLDRLLGNCNAAQGSTGGGGTTSGGGGDCSLLGVLLDPNC